MNTLDVDSRDQRSVFWFGNTGLGGTPAPLYTATPDPTRRGCAPDVASEVDRVRRRGSGRSISMTSKNANAELSRRREFLASAVTEGVRGGRRVCARVSPPDARAARRGFDRDDYRT